MRPERPRDTKNRSLTPITEAIEKLTGEHGHFEGIYENYYQRFLELTEAQVEKLAVAVMLDQEREVRRLADGRTDATAVQRVTEFVRSVFHVISIGVSRF